MATKKGLTTNFFPPLSFVAVFVIRDPRSGIRDKPPGSATLVFSLLRFAKRQTEMEELTQDGVTSTRAIETTLLQSKSFLTSDLCKQKDILYTQLKNTYVHSALRHIRSVKVNKYLIKVKNQRKKRYSVLFHCREY
jgi:hypothetical protein